MLGDAELEKIQQMIEAQIEHRFHEFAVVKKLHDELKQKIADCFEGMRHLADKMTAIEDQVKGHMVGLNNVYNEFQKVRKML